MLSTDASLFFLALLRDYSSIFIFSTITRWRSSKEPVDTPMEESIVFFEILSSPESSESDYWCVADVTTRAVRDLETRLFIK